MIKIKIYIKLSLKISPLNPGKEIQKSYEKAGSILANNLDKLHNMADALLKHETIDQDQISDIMAGALARDKSDNNGTDTKSKTDIPDPSKPVQDS